MRNRTVGSSTRNSWGWRSTLLVVCMMISALQNGVPAYAQEIAAPTPTATTGSTETPSTSGTPTATLTETPDASATLEANARAAESMAQLDKNDAAFIDDQNGYLYLVPKLYWTSDGGKNWRDITPAEFGEPNNVVIQFIDLNIGFVLADVTESEGIPEYILYSTLDAGSSWSAQVLNLPYPDGELLSFENSSVYFVDASNGWVSLKISTSSNFSRGLLFKTADGGASWSLKSEPIGGPVYFADAQTGWIAGGPAGNELYRTLDGGDNWEAVELPEIGLSDEILLPHFYDAENGILPVISNADEAGAAVLYETSDGGATWQLSSTVDLQFVDAGYALSYSGKKEKKISIASDETIITSDGKNSSSLKAERGLPATPKKLFLFDSQAGFSELDQSTCSAENPGGNGKIHCEKEYQLLRTNDGGKTWSAVKLPGVEATSIVAVQDFSVETSILPNELTAAASNTQEMQGQGFDACTVPSYAQLKTWMDTSPYRAVNLYIGGSSRGCSNAALTASFVHGVSLLGWKFIPTWVGPQSPCYNTTRPKISTDVSTAYGQGVENAIQAVDALSNLGLTSSSKTGGVVYYDMEYYVRTDQCDAAVRSFMNGWNAQLKASGNISGIYAITSSNQLGNMIAAENPPKVIWPARWNYAAYDQTASVWNITDLDNAIYTYHQRIRQYAGGHDETWGSVKINIDSNVIDGVISIPQVTQPSPCPATTNSESYVCTPTINPAYVNTCDSNWLPIVGFNGLATYLAENVVVPTTPTNSVTWTPNLLADGKYQVEVFIAAHGHSSVTCGSTTKTYGEDSSAANYVVVDKYGVKTNAIVDQLPINNDWVSLGTYSFARGGNGGFLYLNNATSEPNDLFKNPGDTNISVGAARFIAVDQKISSLSPAAKLAGGGAFVLTVNGLNFNAASVVHWNGMDRPTTFVNENKITAQISAEDIASIGVNQIAVVNTAQGNTVSDPVNFGVTTFADVTPSAWYWRYVEGFYAAGMTSGCATSPRRYCPGSEVTRAQMAVFLLTAMHIDPSDLPAATGMFADVPAGYWAAKWIEKLAADGITSGCAAGLFCPNDGVTRAQMAVFILKAKNGASYVPPAATGTKFSDVPATHWAAAWIEKLAADGITSGCSATEYCPLRIMTRAEMAVLIDKAFGIPPLP